MNGKQKLEAPAASTISPQAPPPNLQPGSTMDNPVPPNSPANQSPNIGKKPRLPRLVKIFSYIFWIPFILLSSAYAYLSYQASQGVSGTEFAGIFLAPIALVVAVSGLIYIVLLLIYAKSKHSSRHQKIASLVIASLLIGIFGWQIVSSAQLVWKINQSNKPLTDAEVINLIDRCQVESVQKEGDKVNLLLVSEANYDKDGNWLWRSTTASSANWDNFVAEVQKVKKKCGGNIDAFDAVAGPQYIWVSVQEATDLLQQCQIKTFNYTPSGLENFEIPSTGTPTGIILTDSTTIKHLTIEPAMESTMIPIARSVQQKCGGPQFYHDGDYEQREADGTWR